MKFGLKDTELESIISTFRKFDEIEDVLLFGSRAMNTYKPTSDIDLAIKGTNVNLSTITSLNVQLEELPIPYMFDIVNYNNITSKELLEQINRYGVCIYLNGWEETTIGELVELAQGVAINAQTNYVLSDKENGIPLLKINNLLNNTIDQYANPELVPKQSIIHKNDIIFTRTGQVGEVLINKYGILHNNSFKVIPNEELHWSYLYWYLKDRRVYNYVQKVAAGSVQKDLNHGAFKTIVFKYPKDIEEQKAIADILTAFDDKIENLQAQNKTLEQTAQTIFKEWFGKYQVGDLSADKAGELPEGWRVGTIGDLIEIRRGGLPRPIKDYISDSGYHWLKISDATATISPYIFEIKEFIKKEGLNKSTLKKKGDLVLSNSATPGLPKILEIDTCVHDGWMHFPESKVSNELLYLLFLEIRPRLVQQGGGSVFVNLKTDILREYPLVIPKKSVFEDIDELIKPIFDKIRNNAQQIQTLRKTRDTLLPKLMSGKIRVNEFND